MIALAALVAVSAPAAQGMVSVTQPDTGPAWSHAEAGMSFAGPGGIALTALAVREERRGETDLGARLLAGDGERWSVELAVAPGAAFLPRTAISGEIFSPSNPQTGPLAGAVVSVWAAAADYAGGDLARAGLGFELYPRGLDGWLTLRAGVSWIDGAPTDPGATIGWDQPLNDDVRLFARAGTGEEADLGQFFRVDHAALGVAARLADALSLRLAATREEGGPGGARQGLSVAVSRGF